MTTTEQKVDRSVIERILKTLALANDPSAAEGEAATAADMVQRLLSKYNLTMAELEMAGGSTQDAKRVKDQHKGKAAYKYQRSLMAVLAELNYCHVLIRREYRGNRAMDVGYVLIGREVNVIVVRQLFEYLNKAVERAVEPHLDGNHQRLSKWAITFKEGATERLIQRLRVQHYERQAEQSKAARQTNAANTTGTGLVVVMEDFAQREKDLNTDLRWGYEPGTTERNRLQAALRREEWLRQQETLVRQEPTPKETKAQREARERREQRDQERWNRRWEREEDARRAKENSTAFRAGRRAGETINLDPQVQAGQTPNPRRLA
jgi:hypothetical protein